MYLLIGDIHSQGLPMDNALKLAKERQLTPVFLGDIFDSRNDIDNTLWCYDLVRTAEEEGAIVLQSNHCTRLRDIVLGIEEAGSHTTETNRTILQFHDAGVAIEDVVKWIQTLPDGFGFTDSRGRYYGCAHAYFLERWAHIEGLHKSEPDEEATTSWGLYDSHPRRVSWWHGDPAPARPRRVRWWHGDPARSWTRVAGHYHTVFVGQSNIVLDANCGYLLGRLPVYDVEAQELLYFDS